MPLLLDIAIGKYCHSKFWTNTKMDWLAICDKVSRTHRTAETLKDYYNFPKDKQDAIKDIGGLLCAFITDQFDFIEAAEVVDVYSPAFYNYTTDACDVAIMCDIERIRNYCITCKEWQDVEKITDPIDPPVYVINGFFLKNEDEAMLIFYINNKTEKSKETGEDLAEDYFHDVFESIWEIYADHVTVKKI